MLMAYRTRAGGLSQGGRARRPFRAVLRASSLLKSLWASTPGELAELHTECEMRENGTSSRIGKKI